jgi:hypothetical protein
MTRLRRPRPVQAGILGAAAALVAACVTPTLSGGCPPARDHAVAYGVVRSAAGEPVAGAVMRARTAYPDCSTGPDQELSISSPAYAAVPPTGADGRYEMRVFSHTGELRCGVRVVAVRAAGDSAFTDVVEFPVVSEDVSPPRHQIDIVFP